MKIAAKCLLLILITVMSLTAFPILHEVGHVWAAAAAGIQVRDLSLSGTPHVILSAEGLTQERLIFTAFGPMVIPLLLMLIPIKKGFCINYAIICLATVSFFDAAESIWAVTVYLSGGESLVCDSVVVLQQKPSAWWVVLLLLTVQLTVSAVRIVVAHPVSRTVGFLEKDNTIFNKTDKGITAEYSRDA